MTEPTPTPADEFYRAIGTVIAAVDLGLLVVAQHTKPHVAGALAAAFQVIREHQKPKEEVS